MKRRAFTILTLLLAATASIAQEPSWRESNAQGQPAAAPPTLQQQPAAAPQPEAFAQAPFTLTPQEQTYLDQVLAAWERQSDKISTFEAKFTRYEYDPVFGPANGAKCIDQGLLKYKKPDKGLFRVDGARPEQWVSDGKSIFEFNHQKKQLVEHQLPPDLQGKAIEDGPLPFLFGAKAEKIKQRYWIQPVAPPPGRQGEICLVAYPRHQQDAANFQKVEVLLSAKDLLPVGIQLHLPNGKSRTSYTFTDPILNETDLLRFLKDNPFSPRAPLGWTKVVEPAAPAQASTETPGGRR